MTAPQAAAAIAAVSLLMSGCAAGLMRPAPSEEFKEWNAGTKLLPEDGR